MNLTRRSFIGMLPLLPFVAKVTLKTRTQDTDATVESISGESIILPHPGSPGDLRPPGTVMRYPTEFRFLSKEKLDVRAALTRHKVPPLTPEDICKMSEAESLLLDSPGSRRVWRCHNAEYERVLANILNGRAPFA